ncbi:MAG: hypothetical protein WCS53_02040 [Bacilli bacterium]|jgi:hypothetical protein
MNPGLTIIIVVLGVGGVLLLAIQFIRARWEKKTDKVAKTEAQYAREEVEAIVIKVPPENENKEPLNDDK